METATAAGFEPAIALGNRHVQTIYAALVRPLLLWREGLQGEIVPARTRIETPDGDFIDVDVVRPAAAAAGAPWVLVLHGLEGSSRSSYVRGIARALVARGIEACLLNYRGCSGEPNRLARSYHSGETEDVRTALRALGSERAGRPLGIVGFSAGANILMKLLGEDPGRAPAELRSAVAVSPPFDLARGARHLDRPAATAYREHLLASLRAKALAKIERFPTVASADVVRSARTFEAFDEAFTAPIHGFRGAEEYWERCSGGRYVAGIAHSLLVIAAEDDPFFPPGYIPQAALAANPHIATAISPAGGHVAFVAGSPLAPRFWAEERAASHLARALGAAASPVG